MTHTEHQKAQFREQFAIRRRRQWIATIPAVAAILGLILVDSNRAAAGLSSDVLVGIAFAVIVGVLIFSLLNWRCPACNGYLGRVINPKFCSKCGAELSR